MAITFETKLPDLVIEHTGKIELSSGDNPSVTLKISLHGVTIGDLARKACQQLIIDWRPNRKPLTVDQVKAEVARTTYSFYKIASKVKPPEQEIEELSPAARKLAVELAKAELAKEAKKKK